MACHDAQKSEALLRQSMMQAVTAIPAIATGIVEAALPRIWAVAASSVTMAFELMLAYVGIVFPCRHADRDCMRLQPQGSAVQHFFWTYWASALLPVYLVCLAAVPTLVLRCSPLSILSAMRRRLGKRKP